MRHPLNSYPREIGGETVQTVDRRDLADALGVSIRTIDNYIAAGVLPVETYPRGGRCWALADAQDALDSLAEAADWLSINRQPGRHGPLSHGELAQAVQMVRARKGARLWKIQSDKLFAAAPVLSEDALRAAGWGAFLDATELPWEQPTKIDDLSDAQEAIERIRAR